MKSRLIAFALMLGLAGSAQCATRRKPPAEKKEAPEAKPKPAPRADTAADGPAENAAPRAAAVSSIEPEELADFEFYPPQIRRMIREALALTRMNLTYTFGSSDPKAGGMDCSGTIFHLLAALGLKSAPRQSDELCGWVRRQTLLHRTASVTSLAHPELAAMQPGDLLFWAGTYETAAREIPVTHVMLYLGRLRKGGRPVMFGASDGRSYNGERRTGVSVFDFTLPKPEGKARFYGYGLIPAIGGIAVKDEPPVVGPVLAAVQPTASEPAVAGAPADGAAPSQRKSAAKPKPKPRAKPAVRKNANDSAK